MSMPARNAGAGADDARWSLRVRAVLGAWSAALAWRREQERLWQQAISEAHALAEWGRAMSREATRQGRPH